MSSSTQKGELTKEEMLKAVIEKAIKGGFVLTFGVQGLFEKAVNVSEKFAYGILFDHDFAKAFWGQAEIRECTCKYEGEPTYHKKTCPTQVCSHCGYLIEIQPPKETGCNHVHYPEDCKICYRKSHGWDYYLQQAVISTDPIQYYYDHI